jgi:predicted dehydrogenase
MTGWLSAAMGGGEDLMAMARPVTIAVVGTGSRGRTYASFAERYPDRARVVAVADPRTERRDVLADRLGVPAQRRFDDWRALAAQGRLADAVVVTTPDREHVGPVRRFAELGYHVLLEKPIAPTRTECVEVVDAVEKTGVILAVCHVLRYTAYTETVRQVVADGRLGQLVGIEHLEPIGWWHFAHSYVRGNWRRADESGPSVLTAATPTVRTGRFPTARRTRRRSQGRAAPPPASRPAPPGQARAPRQR